MPRPWIKVEPAIVNHPKTRQLARLWGCHPYQVVGFLVALWGYCVEYQEDGNVDGLPSDVLDELAAPCCTASGTVRNALHQVGFVEADGRLHDWDEYTGELVERRRKDRERKRLARVGERQDVRRTGRGQVADVRRTSGPRVEQNRAETTRRSGNGTAPCGKPTWLTPYLEQHKALTGGEPQAGKMAAYLKLLHDKHGQATVLARQAVYLTYLAGRDELHFLNYAKFAETFGQWVRAPAPHRGGRPTSNMDKDFLA